ncbi:hypothetical protein GOODEAATRI_014455, partial [Goodea atripinnis]
LIPAISSDLCRLIFSVTAVNGEETLWRGSSAACQDCSVCGGGTETSVSFISPGPKPSQQQLGEQRGGGALCSTVLAESRWRDREARMEERRGAIKEGLVRDLNPGPLAPEARIIPLDQRATCSVYHSLQIGLLHKQLEDIQRSRQDVVAKYEQQLQKLREELEKAHNSLLSQELELERLRPFEALLGRHQMDLQVRRGSLIINHFQPHFRRRNNGNHILDNYSLEDCLAAQGCAGVEILRKDLERAAAKLQGAQLREELERARQTHSGEVEGMKREVSKLTSELHQRDLSIATLSSSSSSIKQQLRSELQRAEQKAAELKVSL